MSSRFVVKGWSEATGRVVEVVIEAADAEQAKIKAESDGLTLIVVARDPPPEPAPDSTVDH